MNGKRPTRKHKEIIARRGLNPDNWLVIKNLPDALHLQHRVSGRKRVLRLGKVAG